MGQSSFERVGFSVVVCTFNGVERLTSTINSIIKLEWDPKLYELIIVDNASTDNSGELCRELLSTHGVNFIWKILTEEKQGLNYARLKGLYEASFSFVLFCDDDNSLSHDYLKIASELIVDNPKIGALGGCGIPEFEKTKPDWFDKYSQSFAVGPQAKQDGALKKPNYLYGAGTFFRKRVLLDFFDKGFTSIMSDRKGKNLASGGDVELCYLIQLAGYELWYDHRLIFRHLMPAKRMQWSYYIKLKQGIASGAGCLLPYVELINNPQCSRLKLFRRWLAQAISVTVVYGKLKVKSIFNSGRASNEVELAHAIFYTKFVSTYSNVGKTFRQFRALRKLI